MNRKRTLAVLLAAVAAAAVVAALTLTSAPGAGAQDKGDPARRDFGTYRLRVDDTVEIVVYNKRRIEPEIGARMIVVPANGEVSFAPVGKLNLLGRTPLEIEDLIALRLKEENYLQEPVVGCFVRSYAPRTVSIIGRGGAGVVTLPTHRDLRILELLATAGTLSTGAVDYSRVQIRRNRADGTPYSTLVNVDDILDRNTDEQNMVIREGDIIRLFELEGARPESAEWVYVTGKVRGPGRHPILKGRTAFTITKLIALCGDFAEFANTSKIRVIRTTETGRVFKELDWDDIIENKAADFELRPDDFVYVPERLF